MFKKILLWCAVILLSVQMFGFSSQNAAQSNGLSGKWAEKITCAIEKVIPMEDEMRESVYTVVNFIVRKCAHFAEYALLSVLVLFLVRSYDLKLKMCVIISLAYCLLFAASDEIHQLFVPGRHGHIIDVGIDFFGAICGAFCGILAIKIKSRTFDKK